MAKSAVAPTARKRAERLASQLRGTELEQRAAELAERIRQSEAIAKAQAKGEELAAKAQAKAEELAARAQRRGEELTVRAQAKGGELATKAQAKGGELADRGFQRIGERLAEGRLGKRLGIQPAKRGIPLWLVGLLGVAAGYVIGLLTAPKRGAELREEVSARAREAVSAARPLVEVVKAELTSDPRTAGLPDLEVIVADGTVFVRGSVPPDFDETALREVISKVPGVHDVDLQVTATA